MHVVVSIECPQICWVYTVVAGKSQWLNNPAFWILWIIYWVLNQGSRQLLLSRQHRPWDSLLALTGFSAFLFGSNPIRASLTKALDVWIRAWTNMWRKLWEEYLYFVARRCTSAGIRRHVYLRKLGVQRSPTWFNNFDMFNKQLNYHMKFKGIEAIWNKYHGGNWSPVHEHHLISHHDTADANSTVSSCAAALPPGTPLLIWTESLLVIISCSEKIP